jgi:DNA polymerase III subunit delta'
MPLVDLYGHDDLKSRLKKNLETGTLPASLLFHGPRGIGKQRLALWLAQTLLCENADAPCGKCKSCRYSLNLAHPDLHWYFPRPRLKDTDPSVEDVRDDYQGALVDRMANNGLYPAPPSNEGIYIATVRAIVHQAVLAPAMGRRKVFIIGDAERMGFTEGSEYAANAFLKLLEEPPADTTVIITSSEPGALLPTIRSRTVAVRMSALSESVVRNFLADPVVVAALDSSGNGHTLNERVQLANGAPGNLFGDDARGKAMAAARKLLEAATSNQASARHAAALAVGSSGARGGFTDILDSLVLILGERMRAALHDGNEKRALAVSRVTDKVGEARIMAMGNVNPQLIAARLLRELAGAFR